VARRYGQLQPSLSMGAIRPPFSAVVWGGARHQMLDAIRRAGVRNARPFSFPSQFLVLKSMTYQARLGTNTRKRKPNKGWTPAPSAEHAEIVSPALPSPQIGGRWAKASPDVKHGYLFLQVVPASVNQVRFAFFRAVFSFLRYHRY
jgi:hypothetical protein